MNGFRYQIVRWKYAFLSIIFSVIFTANAFGAAAGYSQFFVPGDEDTMAYVLRNLQNQGTGGATMHSLVAVTAWGNATEIYIDHWEDGYEFDPDNPVDYDETYTLSRGGAKKFENSNIALNRTVDTGRECVEDPSITPDTNDRICPCDGRDIIYTAGGSATVTRAGWLEQGNTYQAVAWEVYPVRPQLIKYILPFGEDLDSNPDTTGAGDLDDFERVYAFIQATNDNTTIQIDFDADGTYDSFDHNHDGTLDGDQLVIDKGEGYLLDSRSDGDGARDLNTGTTILGSDTIQVQYIIGDFQSSYEVRGLSAFPRGFWDDEYYAPVDDADDATTTDIFLYNPHSNDITINWATSAKTDLSLYSFTIPGKSTVSFNGQPNTSVPQGGAVYLKGSDVFWGISTIDTEQQGNDWGYSLVPVALLDKEYYMGWAPAYDLNQSPATDEQSGLFITAAQDNIVVFIDEDNDGDVEQTLNIDRLATEYVTSSLGDDDLSQARIFSTGPYALAYGQNPDTAAPGDTAAMDLGYTVLPTSDKWFELVLDVEKDVNPTIVDANTDDEQATFTLEVNTYEYIVNDLTVTDFLPEDWEYVDDSTTVTLPNGISTSGNSVDPAITGTNPYKLEWSGTTVFGTYGTTMGENQTITIEFTAQTMGTGFNAQTLTRNEVEAVGTRTLETVTQKFTASDFEFVTYGDVAVEIEKNTGGTDPLSPGDTFEYTVVVTNQFSSTGNLTGISIYDAMPEGISYVAGSSEVSILSNILTDVADDFSSRVYDNSSGNTTWPTPWTETDDVSGDHTDGSVLIPSGSEYLQIGGSSGSNGIQRTVDLSSATAATLSMEYAPAGPVTGSDELILSISDNGGSSWTELNRFSNANQSFNQSIDSYMAGNTTIRLATDTGDFVTTGGGTTDVADDFSSQVYNNSSGTITWATTWAENNDDASPTAGYIQVRGGSDDDLQFTGGASGDVYIERSANILGATSAALSLKYTPGTGVVSADDLVLSVSGNGSSTTWTFSDSSNDSFSEDISAYIDSNTTIRLTATDGSFYTASSIQTVASDDFSSGDYSEGSGWEGDWIEENDDDDPHLDGWISMWLASPYVSFWGNANPGDPTTLNALARRADLEAYEDASSVELRFEYTVLNTELGDDMVCQVCANAPEPAPGSPITCPDGWTTLSEVIEGGGASGSTTAYSESIDPSFMTDGFALRFYCNGNLNWNDDNQENIRIDEVEIIVTTDEETRGAYVDDVKIDYTYPDAAATIDDVKVEYSTSGTVVLAPTGAGDPPNFVSAIDGRDLSPGDVLTLTFAAAVDDPLATGIDTIVNEACVTATEIAVSVCDDSENIVLNPSAASGSVGNRIWLDTDGDGVEDVTESGLSGVEVTLKDEFGTPLQVATTDSNGYYLFSNVEFDSGYYVDVTGGLPAGLTQTTDSRTDDRTDSFNLLNVTTQNYQHNFDSADYSDWDGSIDWSSSSWIEDDDLGGGATSGNIRVTGGQLRMHNTQYEENSIYRSVNIPTDADSAILSFDYAFAGDLEQNNRFIDTIVVEIMASGAGSWTEIDEFIGQDGSPSYSFSENIDSSHFSSDTRIRFRMSNDEGFFGGGEFFYVDNFDVTFTVAGSEYLDADIGYQPQVNTAIIGDLVWSDADGDGVRDPGEPGLGGVTVRLYTDTDGDGEIDTGETYVETTTAADGSYLFTGVAAGSGEDYIVEVVQSDLSAYNITGPLSGTYSIIDAAAGASYLNNDFGFVQNSTGTTRNIKDRVWLDTGAGGGTAGNGVQDGSEAGIANVTVVLRDGSSNIIALTTTDANGDFEFTGVPANVRYTWEITDQNGVLSDYYGTTTPARDGDYQMPATLTTDIDFTSPLAPNFGYNITRSIGGFVWNDIDGGGENDQDSGEPGIAGVTVQLYLDDDGTTGLDTSSDTYIGTTTTDGNGKYLFSGLNDGDYIAHIPSGQAALSGFTRTSVDNDASAGGDQQYETITGGTSSLDADFGYQASNPGSLSGTIWADAGY